MISKRRESVSILRFESGSSQIQSTRMSERRLVDDSAACLIGHRCASVEDSSYVNRSHSTCTFASRKALANTHGQSPGPVLGIALAPALGFAVGRPLLHSLLVLSFELLLPLLFHFHSPVCSLSSTSPSLQLANIMDTGPRSSP